MTNAQVRRARRDALRAVHYRPASRVSQARGSHEPLSFSCRCRGCYCGTQLSAPLVSRACGRGDHRRRIAGRHDRVKEALRCAAKAVA